MLTGHSQKSCLSMREGELIRRILLQASERGARLFRNNTGVSWVGEVVSKSPTILVLQNYRPFHSGLCVGSSDLIGWTPRDGAAIFTAIEAKTGRLKPTHEQESFLTAVERAGGIARVVRESDMQS